MPDDIEKLIELARFYYADGAPGTAAMRLRAAADRMQALFEAREAVLERMIAATT